MQRIAVSRHIGLAGRLFAFAIMALSWAGMVSAGFQSTETYLVAVGRAPGAFGAQIYSTVWATNLTGAPNPFTVYFLKQGQANTSPASFSDTLAPGETKIYENIVESKFGFNNVIGAARIVSAGEILVSERIYNQPSGADLGNTEGFFFAGVPKPFSISSGQSASIQGVNQGGSENFRYNFILVETGGASTTVNVQVFDENGTLLGQKSYPLESYEQLQGNVADIVPSIATINGRITATVTGGAGSALLAGAQVANETQDASGFEMSFRDTLLGGGGSGLTAVTHDATLVGDGTVSTPLGVNPAAVVTSLNGFHGAVTLSAGSNVTITPSGSTLTIAASGGGGGGLTLPFSGSVSDPSVSAFMVTNSASSGAGVEGVGAGAGIAGRSSVGAGVVGLTANGAGPGVEGGSVLFNAIGVQGLSSKIGVLGWVGGVFVNPVGSAGVEGIGDSASGVYGQSASSFGVYGKSSGTGTSGAAVRADGSGIGLFATNNSSDSTIVATNATSGDIYRGFANGGTMVFQVTGAGNVNAHGSFNPASLDYADRLPSETNLEPADVVAIGPDGILRKSTRANDSTVAGVFSTKPGVEGHNESERRPTVPVALAGMIPVRVTDENGPIRPGDLLVSSSTPGHAMKAPEIPAPGTVIGKAMEQLASGSGTIQMLVMLR